MTNESAHLFIDDELGFVVGELLEDEVVVEDVVKAKRAGDKDEFLQLSGTLQRYIYYCIISEEAKGDQERKAAKIDNINWGVASIQAKRQSTFPNVIKIMDGVLRS